MVQSIPGLKQETLQREHRLPTFEEGICMYLTTPLVIKEQSTMFPNWLLPAIFTRRTGMFWKLETISAFILLPQVLIRSSSKILVIRSGIPAIISIVLIL